jgi:hypothetical protein
VLPRSINQENRNRLPELQCAEVEHQAETDPTLVGMLLHDLGYEQPVRSSISDPSRVRNQNVVQADEVFAFCLNNFVAGPVTPAAADEDPLLYKYCMYCKSDLTVDRTSKMTSSVFPISRKLRFPASLRRATWLN